MEDEEYHEETKAYLNEEERLSDSWELLSYAHMLYYRVYVFKNFEAFSNSFRTRGDNPPNEYWEGLSYEYLMDQIKICTAFENYNKAVLLSNGFVVHNINERKNRELAREQKFRPILIPEFLKTNSFVRNEPDGELLMDGLRDFTTLPFSRTLSEGYQEVIRLDARFLDYLKKVNEKRNRLHFYKNYADGFELASYLENLKYAMTYGTARLESEIEKVEARQKELEQ